MADAAWKRTERQVADQLGGVRVPVSGRQRGDAPDIEHATLSLEVKYRATLPAWLFDAYDQARCSAVGAQIPTVVLRQRRQPIDRAFVCLSLADFRRLIEAAGARE